MNQLSLEKRCQILHLLVEGNSLRGISRLMDISINTVLKFVVDIGQACQDYHDRTMVNLPCKRIQCDEIWAFCHSKRKNTPREYQDIDGYGDAWTWLGIDPDSKLIPSWHVGKRNARSAHAFISDLRRRIPGHIEIVTDGFRPYKDAIEECFAGDADFGMLVKLFKDDRKNKGVIDVGITEPGFHKVRINGNPDLHKLTTNSIERFNLSLRMRNRRYARETNAHSKKIENHRHALAIQLVHYNFVRIHQTLRVTPAMAAGLTDRLWGLEDMIKLFSSN